MEEDKLELDDIIDSIRTGVFSVYSFKETLFSLLSTPGRGKIIIDTLLTLEPDISAEDSGSFNIEQMHIRNWHPYIVQLLVDSDGTWDFCDRRKRTVLHYAAKRGWLDTVETLLNKGADPNSKDVFKATPLISATRQGHKDVVDLLIQSGANVLCCKRDNYTLLHGATANRWLDIMRHLLDTGINPNVETRQGVTPLEIAISNGVTDVVALLIEAGAKIKRCQLRGAFILDAAARKGHIKVLEYCIDKFGPRYCTVSSLLDTACLFEQVETIEYLLKELNGISKTLNTALNIIVSRFRPNLNIAKLFIEKGDYFDSDYFWKVLENPTLKKGILQNVHMSTQLIINQFNNKDLPNLYKIPKCAERLPSIDRLTIKSQRVIQDIKQDVQHEIETVGHCNLEKPNVILLSMMAVRSYIDYYRKSQLKRPAAFVSDYECPRKIQYSIQCLDCNEYFHVGTGSYVPRHNCSGAQSDGGSKNPKIILK